MKLFNDLVDIVLNISWTADIAGAVVAMGIAMVWYHPRVFGTIWSQLTGRTFTTKELNWIMPVCFLIYLFLAANITAFCKHFGWQTADKGFLLGYDLGIIICFSMALVALGEQRPIKLYAIEAGFALVSMSAVGLTVGWIL